MALLGRAYSSQELCGVPGIDDIEAHIRGALNDYMAAHNGMNLNGRYDDAVKDLFSTTIVKTIPGYDPSRGISLSTFVYRRIQVRDVTQWLRDNVKDIRYGRQCPDCEAEKLKLRRRIRGLKSQGEDVEALKQVLVSIRVSDTVWRGSDKRECRRCGLVYDDWTAVPLSDAEKRAVNQEVNLNYHDIMSLMNSKVLSPVGRKAMRQLVKPMWERGWTEAEAIRVYAHHSGRTKADVRRMMDDLREELKCRNLLAA